ncbi:MAG TPA: outer membrane beta-barrel protein [Vicinamibacterales bacterium]
MAALLVLLLVPNIAHAQEERLTLSFTPAVAAAAGDTELALAGTAAYRVTEHFSFEGDLTWIDAAAGGFRNRILSFDTPIRTTGAAQLTTMIQGMGGGFGNQNRGREVSNFPVALTGLSLLPNGGPISASTEGSTWIGTMGVRFEPRVQTAKFRPYISGGLGINRTYERFTLVTSATQMADYSASRSGLAFSAGGGANIHVGGALWLAADARYINLSNADDVMRLGGGVTFKF